VTRPKRSTKKPGRQEKLSHEEIVDFFKNWDEEKAALEANSSRAIELITEALSDARSRMPDYKRAFGLLRVAYELLENTGLNSVFFSGFQHTIDRFAAAKVAFEKIEARRLKRKPVANEILKFVTGQRNYPKRGWKRFELFIQAVNAGYEITGWGITLDRPSLSQIKQREDLENTRLDALQLLVLQYCYESLWNSRRTEKLRKVAACARSKKHDKRKKALVGERDGIS
jgi:hypothetical protein